MYRELVESLETDSEAAAELIMVISGKRTGVWTVLLMLGEEQPWEHLAARGYSVKKRQLAAIDIGTNSIRSIVVEANQAGTFRDLDDEKATVRLGDGLHRTGLISPVSRRRALETLARLCKINAGYGMAR